MFEVSGNSEVILSWGVWERGGLYFEVGGWKPSPPPPPPTSPIYIQAYLKAETTHLVG